MSSYIVVLPSAQAATLNRPPDAQAGPSPHAVDGGPNDADGSDDGTVAITLDGRRSTDPDNELNNDITCQDLLTTFNDEDLSYAWYRGHDNISDEDPIALGETPTLDLEYGLHNFTLEVQDKCEQTDTDIVRAYALNTSATTDATWDFDGGAPPALQETEEYWRVTGECDVAADGQYLAFNRPDVCDYDTTSQVKGNATLEFDVGDWFVTGIQFDTLWDTRDDYLDGIQDHMTVQASLDHGHTWTDANLTFNYTQGDYEANQTWVPASGIFDLKNAPYASGNVSFRFTFDTGSAVDTGDLGWLVDNVTILGLRDNTYTYEWNGTTYEGIGDPVKRAGLRDADGDGLPELEPVNITSGNSTDAVLDSLSDQDIINATEDLNLTDAEIKDAINETLDWNETYDDERAEAFEHIDNNYYIEAKKSLTGTPADITYYCNDKGTAPNGVGWVIGIPRPMECETSNSIGTDIALNTLTTQVWTCDTEIDDIKLRVDMLGMDSEFNPEIFWGMSYNGVGGFVDGDEQHHEVTADVDIYGLCGSYIRGEIDVNWDSGELLAGDRLGLFKDEPRVGSTLEATVVDNTDDFELNFDIWKSASGVRMIFGWPPSDRDDLAKVRFRLVMSEGRTVEGFFCKNTDLDDECEGYPTNVYSIEFEYNKIDKSDGGIAHEMRFDPVYKPDALKDAKWHWSALQWDDPVLTFDFNGMPTETWIRLDSGNDNDDEGIASVDITRKDADEWFRTISMDATAELDENKWEIDMVGLDVRRLRMAGGPDLDGSGKWTELTANLKEGELPFTHLSGDGDGFFQDFDQWVYHTTTCNGDDYLWFDGADSGCEDDGIVHTEEILDYQQYFLDTILHHPDDPYAGLEYDEIDDTNDYPCAVAELGFDGCT